MVRSVFLKGFSTILLESPVAASNVGAEEEVLDALQGTFTQLDWRKLSDDYAARGRGLIWRRLQRTQKFA